MPVETVLAIVLTVGLACNAILGIAIILRRRRARVETAPSRLLRAATRPGAVDPIATDGGEPGTSLASTALAGGGGGPGSLTTPGESSLADAEPHPIVLPRGDLDASGSGTPAFGVPPDLVDPLTGLAGPLAWDEYVRDEASRVTRYARPAAVVLGELPGIRQLEERLGREQAEQVIPAIAAVFRREARRCDRVARLGDARFAVLLPETTEEQAANYVERVRRVADRWLEESAMSARLSIGIASPGPSGRLDLALRTAEARMYAQTRESRGASGE